MKKKIVAVLLAACLALAPSLSSADELMDITRAAGYKDPGEIEKIAKAKGHDESRRKNPRRQAVLPPFRLRHEL